MKKLLFPDAYGLQQVLYCPVSIQQSLNLRLPAVIRKEQGVFHILVWLKSRTKINVDIYTHFIIHPKQIIFRYKWYVYVIMGICVPGTVE